MLLQWPTLLLTLTRIAYADVKFTTPLPGQVVPGGGAIDIIWQDSGISPPLSDLTTYELFLCAGGNIDGTTEQWLVTSKGIFAAGNHAQGTFANTIGASSPANAYFFKIIAVAKSGGTVTNYSPRFTLSNMRGVFPAHVVRGLQSVTDTNGPPTENNVQDPAAATPTPATTTHGRRPDFLIPYSMQSGPVIYAPMQSYPPTKITKQTRSPLFPTSPYTLATAPMPPPDAQRTTTEAPTWSFSQRENPASAAKQPNDDWQKYLSRWRD